VAPAIRILLKKLVLYIIIFLLLPAVYQGVNAFADVRSAREIAADPVEADTTAVDSVPVDTAVILRPPVQA
jgi:hypothetical protein